MRSGDPADGLAPQAALSWRLLAGAPDGGLMTVALDTSALLVRYVEEPGRHEVLEAMAGEDLWCASALARTEALVALHRMAATPRQAERLWRELRADWDAFHVVPVDRRCLARAVDIAANYGLTVAHAVHLAAADRLPRPVRYLTLDDRQVAAAIDLGLDLVALDGS